MSTDEKRHARIVDLMRDYYDVTDKIHALQAEQARLKAAVLEAANPGRYGRYSVYKTKGVWIEVQGYRRRSYIGIRRGKETNGQ